MVAAVQGRGTRGAPPFLADIGDRRDAELLNSCGSWSSARSRAVLALDGGAVEFIHTDLREDIARRDLQGAAEAVLALGDGADELLVACWIDAKAPPCGVVAQGAGEDRVRVKT